MYNTHTLRSITWAAIATATLTACAEPYYYHEGITQAQGDRDAYECLVSAKALGRAFYAYGIVTRTADQSIYHRCMVARGWRLKQQQ